MAGAPLIQVPCVTGCGAVMTARLNLPVGSGFILRRSFPGLDVTNIDGAQLAALFTLRCPRCSTMKPTS